MVYCGYAIAAGTRHELPGEEGLAHFVEHTTFKGTEKRSSFQILNELERVGGDLNAFTTKEQTVYYATVLHEHFKRAVSLLTLFYDGRCATLRPSPLSSGEHGVLCLWGRGVA